MSSPLESLKKARRGPMGRTSLRNAPFRHGLREELEVSSSPPEMNSTSGSPFYSPGRKPTDDVLQSIHKATKQMTPRNIKTKAPTDNQLMSLMMERLSHLESQLTAKSKEIIEKDKTIRVLNEKVSILEKNTGNKNQSEELETKCLLQQQQIHEMETFLADYGMVWVGAKTNAESAVYNEPEEEVWSPHSSVLPSQEFQIDYEAVIDNINELNILAGDGTHKIQHTTDGARLKPVDRISLTLYANGILMFDGPFRPFTDPSTRDCVQDFMDGYFPSELQHRYPDGVPIQITDLRDTYFKEKTRPLFDGVGQVLGGQTKPSRLVPSKLTTSTQESDIPEGARITSKPPGQTWSVDQFLNKLPSSVIKDGKVINIRGEISETMRDKQEPVDYTVLDTAVVLEMKKKDIGMRPRSARDVTTLRIKSEKGNHTYIVKMKFSDTVGDVWKYLNQIRPNLGQQFQIVSTFPSRVYSDMKESLQECGLTPNATLHLKPIKI